MSLDEERAPALAGAKGSIDDPHASEDQANNSRICESDKAGSLSCLQPFIHKEPAASKGRFPIYRWDDLDGLPKRSWLIKDLLSTSGLSMLIGASGSMKTFLAICIGAHVALGIDWCGKKVRPSAVLYVAAEGGLGIKERFDAYKAFHNIETKEVPLFVLPQAVDLCLGETDVEALIAEIKAIEQESKVDFALLIVDTLNAVMPGADENTPRDAGLLLSRCRRLREALDTHVMLVHHLGKDVKKGARGHSSLFAAADTEILVKKGEIGPTAEVTKQRDGRTGDTYAFRSQQVDLGPDDDGDPIVSIVVVPTVVEAAAKKPWLRPPVFRALRALEKALDREGIEPPADARVPEDVSDVVSLKAWREIAYSDGISKGGDRAKQKAFASAKQELEEVGLVGTTDEYAWMPDTGGEHSEHP